MKGILVWSVNQARYSHDNGKQVSAPEEIHKFIHPKISGDDTGKALQERILLRRFPGRQGDLPSNIVTSCDYASNKNRFCTRGEE